MSCVVTRAPHRLQELMSAGCGDGPGITQVVRWCCDCGGVVIDVDVDGRTSPGAKLPMLFPALAHERAKLSTPS